MARHLGCSEVLLCLVSQRRARGRCVLHRTVRTWCFSPLARSSNCEADLSAVPRSYCLLGTEVVGQQARLGIVTDDAKTVWCTGGHRVRRSRGRGSRSCISGGKRLLPWPNGISWTGKIFHW